MDSDIEGRVRAFWEQAFNGRELDLIDAITAPEFLNHNALPGTPPGPERHRQVVERLWNAIPDARFEIEHLASAGDTVICVGTMSGCHEGPLLGVEAIGRRVAWRHCHLYRFDETGRMVEHDAIRDDAGLLRQFAEAATSPVAAVLTARLSSARRCVLRRRAGSWRTAPPGTTRHGRCGTRWCSAGRG